jgi:DNA invertase Pin-like site-specific DNA recombinase
MAQKYCEKHNLELDHSTYRDLGMSAFKRRNLEQGALARFIEAVASGKVAKGSYLVIEQFDRLSRAEIDVALRLLLHLVHSGIILVTLVDEKVWDREAVKELSNLILAIVFMSRANNESAMKAGRLREKWDQKKLHAGKPGTKIITSECPRWLRANTDKTGFDVLEDRVESIRKVFAARIGGFGVVSIVNRANKEKWPVPGSGDSWHTSLVGRVLHNRALLGEYQPYQLGDEGKRVKVGEMVPNYYPVVLDETTFLRAQAAGDRKGAFPGRRDIGMRNWLQGMLRCNCGQSMVRKNKNSAKQPGYARYYCTARNRGLTACPGASATELESAVIHVVSQVAPAFFEGTARVDALQARIDILEIDVAAARQTRDRYADAIGMNPAAPLAALLPRLNDAQREFDAREKELSMVHAELADLGGDSDTVFENIVKAVKAVDNLDARAALREDLSRVIEKVVVHQDDGYIRVHLRGTEAPVVQPLRVDVMSIPGLEITVTEGDLPPEPQD